METFLSRKKINFNFCQLVPVIDLGVVYLVIVTLRKFSIFIIIARIIKYPVKGREIVILPTFGLYISLR